MVEQTANFAPRNDAMTILCLKGILSESCFFYITNFLIKHKEFE